MNETGNGSREITYIGFWQRVGMHLLDLLIIGIPVVLLYRFSLSVSITLGSPPVYIH